MRQGEPLDAVSDDEILADIRAAARGDGAAYARIIRHYQPSLHRRMTRFAHSRSDVEELVHEVFVNAYFSLPKFRGDAPFEHWLQKIATRVGYRYWKRQKQQRRIGRESLEAAEHLAQPGKDRTASEAADLLAGLLDQLPPRDRLVITLLYVEDRSIDEAAAMAGWSRTMLKVQAFRARNKLRRLVPPSEAEGRDV